MAKGHGMAHDFYRAFLESIAPNGRPDIVAVYHAVRNIPYGAVGQRDPRAVLANRIGSCSGKHLLLSDLLRAIGHQTQLVTVFTHFNELVPDHESYPEELRDLVRHAEVPDFHHFVRARRGGAWVQLDATWHDRLAAYGFPVNAGWTGRGDTKLAARPLREYPATDDLIALKEQLLLELTPGERALRTRFFGLLANWMASLRDE